MWRCVSVCASLLGCDAVSLGVQVYWGVTPYLWVCKSTGVWRCVSRCASLLGCDAVPLGVQVYWGVVLCLWVCKSTGMCRCVSGCAIPTHRSVVVSSGGSNYPSSPWKALRYSETSFTTHTTRHRHAATPSTSSSEVPGETIFLGFVLCRVMISHIQPKCHRILGILSVPVSLRSPGI